MARLAARGRTRRCRHFVSPPCQGGGAPHRLSRGSMVAGTAAAPEPRGRGVGSIAAPRDESSASGVDSPGVERDSRCCRGSPGRYRGRWRARYRSSGHRCTVGVGGRRSQHHLVVRLRDTTGVANCDSGGNCRRHLRSDLRGRQLHDDWATPCTDPRWHKALIHSPRHRGRWRRRSSRDYRAAFPA
jgi:hypothetical protein